MPNHIENIKNLTFKNDKTALTCFSERVIKHILREDDENTKQMIIDYARKRYPNENVRIDFIDEEKVNLIIELGLQEYQKRQNERYDIKVLRKFNTENDNIEGDIKILENLKTDVEMSFGGWCNRLKEKEKQALENLLNAYKKNQTAIETVLQELDNSISKDKVREVLEKYRYTNVDDIDSLLNFYQDLKKLLEDK